MTRRPLVLACTLLALAACQRAPSTDGPGSQAPAEATAPAASAPAVAAVAVDPEAEVKASMDKFLAARTFHVVMTSEGAGGMASELDFVAPDRYRMVTPAGTQLIIGDALYLQAKGRSMKVPLPAGTLSQWRDPLKIEENKAGLSVEALGDESLGGTLAKKYLVRHTQPEPSEFTYWVGNDGLPVQLLHKGQAKGKPYSMTLRYSRFDDPAISIDPPQ